VSNVFDRVLAYDLCCGCGVCAGVAPCAMEMTLTKQGEYQPTAPDECTDCGMCLAVCPFASAPTPPTTSPLGETLACYVGHVPDNAHRLRAASGGLTTALLAALLRRGEVDAVVAVRAGGKPEPRFEAAVLDSETEVLESASSRYYPIQFSAALRQMHEEGRRYAAVALPCVARALRLARDRCAWLRESLLFVVALACGQSKSARYTSHLIAMSGLSPEDVAAVNYRATPSTRADDFVFTTVTHNGHSGRPLPFISSTVRHLWNGRFYSLNSCLYCEDMFGEYAHASVMDAWLPEYRAEVRGTTIICLRDPILDAVMQELRESAQVQVEAIEPNRVLETQRGNLRFKSAELSARLMALQRRGVQVPTVRIAPEPRPVPPLNRLYDFNRRLSRWCGPGSLVLRSALGITAAISTAGRYLAALRRRLPRSSGDE